MPPLLHYASKQSELSQEDERQFLWPFEGVRVQKGFEVVKDYE